MVWSWQLWLSRIEFRPAGCVLEPARATKLQYISFCCPSTFLSGSRIVPAPRWQVGTGQPRPGCALTSVCNTSLCGSGAGAGRQPRPAFFLCPGLTNYDRRGEAQRPNWTVHVWPEILNGAPKCPSFQRREKRKASVAGHIDPDAAPTTTARVTQNPLSFPSPSNTSQKNLPF